MLRARQILTIRAVIFPPEKSRLAMTQHLNSAASHLTVPLGPMVGKKLINSQKSKNHTRQYSNTTIIPDDTWCDGLVKTQAQQNAAIGLVLLHLVLIGNLSGVQPYVTSYIRCGEHSLFGKQTDRRVLCVVPDAGVVLLAVA